MALCLTTKMPFVISGALMGGVYGVGYALALRKMTVGGDEDVKEEEESKYVDKSFKL